MEILTSSISKKFNFQTCVIHLQLQEYKISTKTINLKFFIKQNYEKTTCFHGFSFQENTRIYSSKFMKTTKDEEHK